jgi:transcriptional regulator with XRE-family HTH domain
VKPRTRKRSQGRHRSTPDPLAKLVGARIRELRTEAEFTFDAFVEETGLGRGYVSELERGTVVPTIGTLAKVAKALQVGLMDLVAVTGTPREELLDATRDLSEADVKAVLRTVQKVQRPKPKE